MKTIFYIFLYQSWSSQILDELHLLPFLLLTAIVFLYML
jgi:hypothetical protein